jgi:hypothetical protein
MFGPPQDSVWLIFTTFHADNTATQHDSFTTDSDDKLL